MLPARVASGARTGSCFASDLHASCFHGSDYRTLYPYTSAQWYVQLMQAF